MTPAEVALMLCLTSSLSATEECVEWPGGECYYGEDKRFGVCNPDVPICTRYATYSQRVQECTERYMVNWRAWQSRTEGGTPP